MHGATLSPRHRTSGQRRATVTCRDFGRRNGNEVYQHECNGAPNQHWEFVGRPGESGSPRNKWSGRCLDVSNLEFRDGAAVQVWDCSGAWNQLWSIW